MFQNFDLVSGLTVIILDFSDKQIVSFKVYTVTRKFYEYSEYWSTLTRQWPAQARENSYITFVRFQLFRAAIQ